MGMIDVALTEYKTHRDTKSLRIFLLSVITEAQRDIHDCPWCEVPIGATHQHYLSDCPFKHLADLIEAAK